ncbi:MAG: UDP-2,3-diacylglucosamine diphosphatase LpxI [Pseudomonadota bacterium]
MVTQNTMDDDQSPIGILAGGGSLPLEIAQCLREQGRQVVIVVLEGEADELAALPGTIVRNWGRIGGIVSAFKDAGCRQMLIVGSVNRPDLTKIKPDLGLFRALFTIVKLIRAGGDDAVLRGVIAYLAKMGLTVLGPADVAPGLLVKEGPLPGTKPLPASDVALSQRAFELLTALAPFDVGQGVVISKAGIEAIEGAEGTDRMLARVASKRRDLISDSQESAHGLLVKQPKSGQDLRVDLPAIGPRTIDGIVEANLTGIVAEADRVIALSREELIRCAISADLSVTGITPKPTEQPSFNSQSEGPTTRQEHRIASIGSVPLRDVDRADALRCAAVSEAMEPYGCGRVVVAARGHVLSVQAGDEPIHTIARVANLRQWGEKRWRRRSGMAVLAAGHEATPELIERVAETGLAGFAIRPQKLASHLGNELIELADEHKLCIAELIAS